MMSSTKFKKIAQATSCLLFSLSKKVLLDFAILAYDCRFFGNDSQTSQRGLKIISEKSQMMQARLIFLQFSNTVSWATLIKLWKSSQKFLCNSDWHCIELLLKWNEFHIFFISLALKLFLDGKWSLKNWNWSSGIGGGAENKLLNCHLLGCCWGHHN